MENFEQKLVEDIKRNILRGINEAKFVESWNQSKVQIPQDVVLQAYSMIDREKILQDVKTAIEEQIAKTIVGSLLTETATDTKRILQDQALRQQIKNKVYPEILKLANGIKEE